MQYLIESIEGYRVLETERGLEVYDKDDNFVCELYDCTMRDFKDEWGNIDENELYDAIREEEAATILTGRLREMM